MISDTVKPKMGVPGTVSLGGVALLTVLGCAAVWLATRDLSDSSFFHPHGYCYLWEPGLVWTHVGADAVIGIAYMTIPLTLLTVVRRAKGQLPFGWVLLAFGTFIVACGLTHFVEILTLWQPWYWTAASLKVITAIASLATAAAVPPLVPRLIATLELSKLAEERRVSLEQARDQLEARVADRTLELTQTVGRLRAEIEARRLAEHHLALSEARLQGILDHSPSYIYVKDLQRRFVLVNRRLAEVYGGPDHLLGKANSDLFPETLAREYDRNDQRVLDGETIQELEHEDAPTGPRVHLSEKFPLRDGTGAVVAIGGISTDITERHIQEQARESLLAKERELREQAEDLLRQKDEFLAVISHELRTPLNAITGYLHLMQLPPVNPDELPRMLQTVDRNAKALRRLVEDLLTMSGAVIGKLDITAVALDLTAVIRNALDTVSPSAERADVIIVADLPDHLRMVGDADRLHEVLVNVIGNAVKFSPGGGAVSVTASVSAETAIVTVRDQGPGIPESFRSRMFEPFQRADASRTRRTPGLGLGLAITKRLVEAHDGRIAAVNSGDGGGAVFTVTLPLGGPAPRPIADL